MKNVTIYCKDFDLTDAVKGYLEEKLAALDKYFDCVNEEILFNARLGKVSNHHNNGKIFYAEVAIKTPNKNFGARKEAEEVYAAIDLLKDELAENISHYKDKSRTQDRKKALKFKQSLRAVEE